MISPSRPLAPDTPVTAASRDHLERSSHFQSSIAHVVAQRFSRSPSFGILGDGGRRRRPSQGLDRPAGVDRLRGGAPAGRSLGWSGPARFRHPPPCRAATRTLWHCVTTVTDSDNPIRATMASTRGPYELGCGHPRSSCRRLACGDHRPRLRLRRRRGSPARARRGRLVGVRGAPVLGR